MHQKKKLSCDDFQLECATLSFLLRHKKIHKNTVLHSCESCNKKFSRADALNGNRSNLKNHKNAEFEPLPEPLDLGEGIETPILVRFELEPELEVSNTIYIL